MRSKRFIEAAHDRTVEPQKTTAPEPRQANWKGSPSPEGAFSHAMPGKKWTASPAVMISSVTTQKTTNGTPIFQPVRKWMPRKAVLNAANIRRTIAR